MLAALALVAALAVARPAVAQSNCTATVTSTGDNAAGTSDIPGTLRFAIDTTSGGAICFNLPSPSTITLQSSLVISNVVTVQGPGSSALTVSGGGNVEPFLLNLQNSSTNPVLLEGITITGGSGKLGGGVYLASGAAELFQVAVTGNTASDGAGVYNAGTLTIQNSTITGNTTTGNGGGISNGAGATLTLTTVAISANTAAGAGGGIANEGSMSLEGTNVYSNTAPLGGGIYNDGQFTTTGTSSQIDQNSATDGGGIFNDASGVATLIGMSLNSNAANGSSAEGGGISNGGILQISESTFAANTSGDIGGAIYNLQTLTLINNTLLTNVAAQAGGGIYNDLTNSDNTLNLHNNVISGNTTNTSGVAVTDCVNCGQPSADNLVGVDTTTLNFGPLAANGGTATTFMPLPGSPAIAGGIYQINSVPIVNDPIDERGLARTTVNGNTILVDIGAVQTHYSSVSFTTGPGGSQTAGQVITPTVQVSVIENDGVLTNYPLGVPVTMQLQTQDSAGPPTLSPPMPTAYPSQNPDGPPTAKFANLSIDTAGSYLLVATTYPTDQDGQMSTYSGTSGSFTVAPAQQTTTLAWTPASYVYAPLPASELNATISINGAAPTPCSSSCTYAFSSAFDGAALAPGTVYPAGTYGVEVIYTGANGQQITESDTLTVTKATPAVTLVSPAEILPGAALTRAMLHATATGIDGSALPGTYSYSPALGSVPASSSFTATATFTPSDGTDYATAEGSATLTVQAPIVISTSATITPSSAHPGTAESLLALVQPAQGVVSGTISISNGLGSEPLVLLPNAGSFSVANGAAISFSASAQMASYTADLNGDGVADQVVIIGTQLQLLLSNLASASASPVTLNTYGACFSISGVDIGDVNGDGLPDIVAACQNVGDGLNDGGPIVVYLNQGNGSFAAPVATGGQGSSALQGANLVLADFNGDGILDLVSLGAVCPYIGAGPCFVYQQGNGDGTFQAASSSSYVQLNTGSTADTFDSLQTGDFNGDGVPDLALIRRPGGTGGQLEVWVTSRANAVSFGNGGGDSCYPGPCYSASAVVTPGTSGNAPVFLVADDLNGDGIPDLAAVMADGGTGAGNTLSIAINSPSGNAISFPASTTDTVYAGAQSLGVADFNQDGFADIAIATFAGSSNTLAVELGDGSGSFATAWPNGVTLVAPVSPVGGGALLYPTFTVGDANGDGFPDLLLAQPATGSQASGQVAITTGDTQATFATTAPSQTTTYTATTTPASKLYAGSTGSATLTVAQDVVTLAWTPGPLTYETAVPAAELNAAATLNGAPYSGSFAYSFTATGTAITAGATSTNPAGVYPVQVVFTPAGSTQTYTLGTSLTIQPATPALALTVPATLLAGVKLSTANVHAVATNPAGALLAGTFSYSEALGSVPSAGSHTITVNFAPADATDYLAPAAQAATFSVLAAEGTTTTLTASPNPALPGALVTLSASIAPGSGTAGAVPGSVTFNSASGALATSKLALDPAIAKFVSGNASQVPGSFDYNTISADFNGDGVADLLIVPLSSANLQLLLSQPGATPALSAPVSVSLGSACTSGEESGSLLSLAVGDVNSDGLPDIALVCSNFDSTSTDLVVLINQGGSFTASAGTPLIAENSAQLVFGDFNSDGKQDLALITDCASNSNSLCLYYLPGDGTGNFTTVHSEVIANGVSGDSYSNPVVADFNHDGHPDLAWVHTPFEDVGAIEVWKFNPGTTPSFGTASADGYQPDKSISAGTGGALASLVSADFNQDGLPDLAVLAYPATQGQGDTTSVALNTSSSGTLNFPAATTDTANTAGPGSSIVTADFDGDGIPDLALYNSTDNTVKVLHGAGDGTFSSTEANLGFTLPAPVSEPIEVSHPLAARRGRAQVRPYDSYLDGTAYPVLAVGDTNGDGYPDLLVGYLTENGSGNISGNGQQFVTSGSSVAKTTTTAASGSATYSASTVPSVPLWTPSNGTVTLGSLVQPTRTSLVITPAAPSFGQTVTLTATVVNASTDSPATGGSVTFTEDGVPFTQSASPSVPLNSAGQAVVAAIPSTAGQHVFAAAYDGTATEGPSTAGSQTIQIAKVTPRLTWLPAALSATMPLGSAQLDATAVGLAGSTLDLPGSFVYSPAAGTVLSVGTHTLSVTFTPTDATDYTTATATVQIQVNPTLTQTTLAVSAPSSTYGQPLTLTAHVVNTTGQAVVSTGNVAFTANGAALASVAVTNGVATLTGVVLPAGQPVLEASYSSPGSEGTSAGTATVTVAQATPALAWPTPAAISSTTPLSAVQLDATAVGVGTTGTLKGSFVYTPAAGTTLTVGTHTLNVTFTPADVADYTTAKATVQIVVQTTNTQTSLTVTPGTATYGQMLALAARVVNTSGAAVIQSGSVIFSADGTPLATVAVVNGVASLSGVSLNAGQHLLAASYTGATGEGTSASAGQTIAVAKALPALTWPTPAQIAATTALGSTQLNATAAGVTGAALPGTYAYTPAAGTMLSVGAHTLSVTFTPTDGTDYATATTQVPIQVVAETITLTSLSPSTSTLSNAPLAVTLTGSGFPSSAVVQLNGTTLPTKVLSSTQLNATIPATRLATAGALTFTLYDAASNAVSNALPFTVTAPTPNVTVTAPSTTISGDQPTLALAIAQAYPVDLAGTFTLTFTPAGAHGVDDPNVQFQTGGRTLNFTIPAGTTAGPSVALQAGTVDGTIAITTTLNAGGANVTPPDIAPTSITIAPAAPTITGVTFTDAQGLLTVVVTGYSNTREMVAANFVFLGPGVPDLAVPDVNVPAVNLFGGWYGSTGSADFGSTFSYTQTFQLSDPTTNITGVSVTLTNTVGASTSVNSQ